MKITMAAPASNETKNHQQTISLQEQSKKKVHSELSMVELKTGDFVDYETDGGKWIRAEVMSVKNNQLELKYSLFRSSIPVGGLDSSRTITVDNR